MTQVTCQARNVLSVQNGLSVQRILRVKNEYVLLFFSFGEVMNDLADNRRGQS